MVQISIGSFRLENALYPILTRFLETVIEIDAEYEWQGQEELASTENWVHINPEILKSGTVKHTAPPGLNEDDAAEYVDKLAEKDPVTERLRSLAEDTRKKLSFLPILTQLESFQTKSQFLT